MIVKFYVEHWVRCVDEIEIKGTNSHRIRAILFPESSSATESCHGVLEESVIDDLVQKRLSPSPDDLSWEDEAEKGHDQARPTKHRHARTSQPPGRQPVILLIQSPEVHRFGLGSSQENDIVLKFNGTGEEVCYVNWEHCHIYPHPDKDAVVLYNNSTSTFSIGGLESKSEISIAPGRNGTVTHGTWRLSLGEGLCFQIRVLPRPPPAQDGCTRSLLSTCERPPNTHSYAASASISRGPVSLPATTKSISKASKRRVGFHNTPSAGSRNKELPESQIHQANAPTNTHGGNPGSQGLANSSRGIEATTKIAATNAMTKVFKVSRHGAVFAAKVCRHPDLKSAADTWKWEATTLQDLDHVSLTFDASRSFSHGKLSCLTYH